MMDKGYGQPGVALNCGCRWEQGTSTGPIQPTLFHSYPDTEVKMSLYPHQVVHLSLQCYLECQSNGAVRITAELVQGDQ